MASHTDKAFVTYGKLTALLQAERKTVIDGICPVGGDLILAVDLGSDYATKLAALFPGTTWSGKTTVYCAKDRIEVGIVNSNNKLCTFITQQNSDKRGVLLGFKNYDDGIYFGSWHYTYQNHTFSNSIENIGCSTSTDYKMYTDFNNNNTNIIKQYLYRRLS